MDFDEERHRYAHQSKIHVNSMICIYVQMKIQRYHFLLLKLKGSFRVSKIYRVGTLEPLE